MPQVLDIEQSALLLELDPPFDKREIQLARRRMAKRWHPDIAPPGKQFEHERHLKAINEAADQLERIAEDSRGGRVSRNAVKVSAAAARAARAEAGRRAYEAQERERAAAKHRAEHDPFHAQAPAHSVVHRYARCVSYPEWGVGSVTGIYFTGEGDDIQQWARVKFQVGVRTVPAGSLQFVDFSKPDPGAERVQRFMTAAQHALAEGDYPLAAQRLVYARDAEPANPAVLRLMTLAFWQSGDLRAAGRAVRDWARVEGDRPVVHRFAARIYEDMGAIGLAAEAAEREAQRAPAEPSGVGARRAAAPAADGPRRRARGARARPRARRERRGTARPGARPPPRGRGGRGGVGQRGGDPPRPRVRRRVVALRARPRAHRPDARLPARVRARPRAGCRPRGLGAPRARPRAPAARAAQAPVAARRLTRTGGGMLVAALEAAGVEVVFGLPGVHNLAAWSALAESPIRLITVRHEQTAVYAADGYARAAAVWESPWSRPGRAPPIRSGPPGKRGHRARPCS